MTSEMLALSAVRTRNHPHELTKRVHQLFPDAQVKVKPIQANKRIKQ